MRWSVLLLAIAISGCEVGYRVKSESVVWVHWNEGSGRVESPLANVIPGSFQRLEGPYGTDSIHVYYKATLIEDADPSTFHVLSDTYAKDAKSLYFMGSPVAGANPTAVKVLDTNYAVDGEAVYYRKFRVLGANPDKFSMREFERSEVFECYSVAEFFGCEEPYSH